MNNSDLIKLDENKIKNSNENKRTKSTFLTLALIRNDISDLVYLQNLFVDNTKDIEYKYSAESGQRTGRMIYIMRLALSHYYEFLIFLSKRKIEISNDLEFQIILKKLDKNDKKVWNNFIILASELDSKEQEEKYNSKIDYIVSRLAKSIRGNLTFHYFNSSHFLYKGFKDAFILDKKEEKNMHPLATEMSSVSKDRSYYIDLSIQRYLENESKLNEDLFKFEKNIINTIADVNMILSRLLEKYHSNIRI